VLMFTASGLVVRFLKVFEPTGYSSVKWVRYLTKASGSYQIRVRAARPPTRVSRRSWERSFEFRVCICMVVALPLQCATPTPK
jgi:hypothetical protein